MYRKYLDSEITFDELVDLVAGLDGEIAGLGEPIDDLRWDLPSLVKMFEPVSCNHHNGDYNDSNTRKIAQLAWYFEPDLNERAREWDEESLAKMREIVLPFQTDRNLIGANLKGLKEFL
jgi:hypothetical protein